MPARSDRYPERDARNWEPPQIAARSAAGQPRYDQAQTRLLWNRTCQMSRVQAEAFKLYAKLDAMDSVGCVKGRGRPAQQLAREATPQSSN